jgi:hypothetical protein
MRRSWILYAPWLPVPALALIAASLGSARSRRKQLLSWLLLGMLTAATVVTVGCSSGGSGTTSSAGSTPNNAYTFTVSGTDENSIAASNGTQSVSLTVN